MLDYSLMRNTLPTYKKLSYRIPYLCVLSYFHQYFDLQPIYSQQSEMPAPNAHINLERQWSPPTQIWRASRLLEFWEYRCTSHHRDAPYFPTLKPTSKITSSIFATIRILAIHLTVVRQSIIVDHWFTKSNQSNHIQAACIAAKHHCGTSITQATVYSPPNHKIIVEAYQIYILPTPRQQMDCWRRLRCKAWIMGLQDNVY